MQAHSRMFWGPLTALGLIAAAIACALDQASKLWLLEVFDLAHKGVIKFLVQLPELLVLGPQLRT